MPIFNCSYAAELARIGNPNPWFMAGGTLLDSCDSRFAQATGHSYAINFHDRCDDLRPRAATPPALNYDI